jgi:hypothetical protein
VIEKCIDESPSGDACGRMDNHAARLIDDNDISVFIENIKGDVLRTDGELLRRGEIARDALSSA